MKKIVILSFLFLFASSVLFAQTLANNKYYQKSVEFANLSEQVFDEGKYDLSVEYSIKSQEYAALSRSYIAEMVLAYRARTAITAAKQRIEMANRYNIKSRDSALYEEASASFASANEKFTEKDYTRSIEDAEHVIALLKNIKPVPKQEILPEYYEVILNVKKRDCLWRIAGYKFVYSNPLKWPVLYEENKKNFHEPDNPHLIFPGEILKIPSIDGEVRSGKWGE